MHAIKRVLIKLFYLLPEINSLQYMKKKKRSYFLLQSNKNFA